MRAAFHLSLGLLGSLLSLTAVSAAPLTFAPPHAGDSRAYSCVYRGQFWQDTNNGFNGTLTVTREDATHFDAAWSAGSDNVMISGAQNGLGGIDTANSIEWLDPYNTVAQLLFPLGGDIASGASWSAQAPVHVNPGELVQVPVMVNALDADKGRTTTISFTGRRSGLYSYSGFIVPMDIETKGTLSFDHRQFVGGDYAVQEAVHLGGTETHIISWTWTFAAR